MGPFHCPRVRRWRLTAGGGGCWDGEVRLKTNWNLLGKREGKVIEVVGRVAKRISVVLVRLGSLMKTLLPSCREQIRQPIQTLIMEICCATSPNVRNLLGI